MERGDKDARYLCGWDCGTFTLYTKLKFPNFLCDQKIWVIFNIIFWETAIFLSKSNYKSLKWTAYAFSRLRYLYIATVASQVLNLRQSFN